MLQPLHHLKLFSVQFQAPAAVFQNLLDRPEFIRSFVHRQIHDAHAASSYDVQNLIFSVNDGSDFQHILFPSSVFVFPAFAAISGVTAGR